MAPINYLVRLMLTPIRQKQYVYISLLRRSNSLRSYVPLRRLPCICFGHSSFASQFCEKEQPLKWGRGPILENCAHHRGKVHPAAFAPDRMAHALCQLDGIKAMNVKMGGKILKISMPIFMHPLPGSAETLGINILRWDTTQQLAACNKHGSGLRHAA